MSYIFEKTLAFLSSKCKNEDEQIYLKKIYNYFKNVVGGNISQELRLRNIDQTRNISLKK